ncbi:MAG: hypothetical protein R3335_14920 [Anaerolineales bacterium]|nr:hypothetical protein [Anaerolineales bacterium]
MKKTTLSILVVLAIGALIAACQTAAPGSQTATIAPEAPATLPPLPTAEEVRSGPAQCSVVSSGIAPAPDPNSPFETVNELDWKHGPEDALITFIEYGDFQ